MGKHCPQLGSTWPRSVHFWKVKLTYFPVICQYLTFIWQEKKAFGTACRVHSALCFLSASSDDTLFGTTSIFAFLGSSETFRADYEVNVRTTCCHNNLPEHLRSSCRPQWKVKKEKVLIRQEVGSFCLHVRNLPPPPLRIRAGCQLFT